jgi:hypothetical protein
MASLTRERARRSATLGVLIAALLGASGGPLSCEGFRHFGIYVLEKGSSVEEGCFDPCLCPILLLDDLRGLFVLAPLPRDPASPFRSFAVRWVRWGFRPFREPTRVVGNGTYEITGDRFDAGGELPLAHRLTLDLEVGDEPVQTYDSGLVPGGSDAERFPPIEIAISRNGMYCYDRVFSIRAKPVLVF